MTRPETLCMAPWTHTYLSPQTERRMCCASREPAQNFQQYIDTAAGTGEYRPVTLDEHWNSEHMRSVRRRMMTGETLPECEVCNNKLLNTDVYRSYFNSLFGHKYAEAMQATAADGHTTMQPVSWDYRFSNLCNFKCRTCGDMLSSSWEAEQRQHNMINWSNPKNNWMRLETRERIREFQADAVEQEFATAVEQHRVEEVYWVGGEPLMYEQHWKYMRRIVELGDGPGVYARYNTNLSRVEYQGTNLWSDILTHIRDWQICASIDGVGTVGEYIRTGLNYNAWLANFQQGLQYAQHPRQMRLDFTLTLPGLTQVWAMQALADQLGVELLAKVMFAFSPDIVMSPNALPRGLRDSTINTLLHGGAAAAPRGALKAVLEHLLTQPTFAETWPDQWESALTLGKQRVQHIERIRGEQGGFESCLAGWPELEKWYEQIPA